MDFVVLTGYIEPLQRLPRGSTPGTWVARNVVKSKCPTRALGRLVHHIRIRCAGATCQTRPRSTEAGPGD